MNSELIALTSMSNGSGIELIDIDRCSQGFTSFKNCMAEPGCICQVSSGSSSFSGEGGSGDFLAVAQSKKPVVHVYQWGKPQAHFQCHTQEIVTSITSFLTFLVGGTKRGWIYLWDVSTGSLLRTWQAHFKSVNRLYVTKDSQFIISASGDGIGKVWDISKVMDASEDLAGPQAGRGASRSGAYRSWNPHTLPIKDMHVVDALGVIRVITCSLDKTIVMYDVHNGQQCLRLSLPEALEAVVSSPSEDFIMAGGSSGSIFRIDSSVASAAMSAMFTSSVVVGTDRHRNIGNAHLRGGVWEGHTSLGATIPGRGVDVVNHPSIFETLTGHIKAVTALMFSKNNTTLVSASEDGTLRTWNVWTKQCLHQCTPMNKCGISNALVSMSEPILSTILRLRCDVL